MPGEGGRGLHGEGGRLEVSGGGLENELDLLGGLGGCRGEGVTPKAAWAWRVMSVSPGGKFKVAVIINENEIILKRDNGRLVS